MDTHSLRVLEFDKVCEFLKSFTASPGGQRVCETLRPANKIEAVEELLQETSEMRSEIDLNGPLPLSGIHDIRRAVERSRIKQFYLEPEHLLQIKDLLETADIIKKYFSGAQDTGPLLHRITEGLNTVNHVTGRIRKSISPQGEILDNASARLAEIRTRLKKLRLNIIKTLEQLITDEDISYAFQDDFITLRNNRYVIPVRSDSKSIVPGVVHDQSQTKATFFVEPLSVVNLNNELQILRKDEYYEEIKILTEITRQVNEYGTEILATLQIMERIDVIHAKALFSKALHATKPLVNGNGIIKLSQCRHPILLAEFMEEEQIEENQPEEAEKKGHWEFTRPGVVAIDLVKGNTISTLIITGANAGGKTVAMKTLGLFVLMTQAGMHIPAAADSTISIHDNIFADIGDEQSIATSLSTFSAHMAQIKSIVSHVSSTSLVLLDELGSGTDPTEGGALAVAILDFLRECGCCTLITTHLNILKTYAYNNADVENISVEFDPVTLKPCYRLVYGVPGISNALAIAKNIGIPDNILTNATRYLDKSDKQIAELMHGLEKSQKEIAAERHALAKIRQRAQDYHKAAESLLAAMKNRKEKILKAFETNARTLLRESEEQLTRLIKDQKRRRLVRPEDTFKNVPESKKAFSRIQKKLTQQFPKTEAPRVEVQHLEIGQTVRVCHLDKDGIVVAADNKAKKAEVAVGTMRVKTFFRELEPVHIQPQDDNLTTGKTPAAVHPQPQASGAAQQVNVIGMRAADALPIVDKTLDNALVQGAETVEIIHGRGTGRLMKAIHEHLQEHQNVGKFKSGDAAEGGSGVTIVTIK